MPTPNWKTVNKELTFILTEADFANKAKNIAEQQARIDDARRTFDEAKATYNAIETEAESMIGNDVRAIRAKKEVRAVDCLEIRDFQGGEVLYEFNGSVMERRPMTADEMQPALPFPKAEATDQPSLFDQAATVEAEKAEAAKSLEQQVADEFKEAADVS